MHDCVFTHTFLFTHVHVTTCILYSYTLECNYNSGRQSNYLSSATCDNSRASPSVPYSPMPQRFSIASFEQVHVHVHCIYMYIVHYMYMYLYTRIHVHVYTCIMNILCYTMKISFLSCNSPLFGLDIPNDLALKIRTCTYMYVHCIQHYSHA